MADAPPYQLAPETPTRLLHCASERFAEPQDTTTRSLSVDHTTPLSEVEDNKEARDVSEPVTLGLAIRRTRLVAFTATMLTIICGFTLWFHHGVALSHFDSRDKNATEQTKLLDDYNSYSGNVVTIFATPVELFVTVAVQVIVLWFMADTFTRPEMSWKISGITLLLGAGVGYMISNGFNALNVQLRPEEVSRAIVTADLGISNDYEEDGNTTTELTPQNAAMNTLLRTILSETAYTGMPFDMDINDGVNSSTLPMKTDAAAMLFDNAMSTGTYFFPWGERRDYVNKSDVLDRNPVNDSETHNLTDSPTRMNGLLPMDANASESTQREFFLPAALAAASRQFAKANRTKISDIVM